VTIGTHIAIDKEIVEKDKVKGQRVVVGSDLRAEKDQARVTVPFRNIAQDLVVGTVFFQNVKDILNWTRLSVRW
jgi:hypothetical protein